MVKRRIIKREEPEKRDARSGLFGDIVSEQGLFGMGKSAPVAPAPAPSTFSCNASRRRRRNR